jgi:nucleoside-diphosphate-sugar epimerase
MRIGVTGGAGFIGGHVVDELLKRGHEPVIFDHRSKRHPVESRPGSGHFDSYIPTMLGDTRDEVAVTELAAHTDGIIHLASVLGTQETVHNPRPAVQTNVASGLNVFEACVQYGLPCVNICVGNHGMSNPYSASKTCVESLGHMFVRDRGLALNQVRVVNAYGPRQVMAAPYGPGKVRKIMPAFIARALTGTPIEVYGDGQQISDCVYVTDVARGLVQALEYAAKGDVLEQVVEIGPSEHATVAYVANLVIQEAREIGYDPAPSLVHLPMRPGETPGARVVADNETMRLLGLEPDALVPLGLGVHDTVEWFAAHWLPGHLASRG